MHRNLALKRAIGTARPRVLLVFIPLALWPLEDGPSFYPNDFHSRMRDDASLIETARAEFGDPRLAFRTSDHTGHVPRTEPRIKGRVTRPLIIQARVVESTPRNLFAVFNKRVAPLKNAMRIECYGIHEYFTVCVDGYEFIILFPSPCYPSLSLSVSLFLSSSAQQLGNQVKTCKSKLFSGNRDFCSTEKESERLRSLDLKGFKRNRMKVKEASFPSPSLAIPLSNMPSCESRK